MHACHNTYVEARRQLAVFSPSFYSVGDQTSSPGLTASALALWAIRIPWFIFQVRSWESFLFSWMSALDAAS